ncbi:MAG: discoidin domain-containing protein [Phycisphaerae bacterium]|nr:discoidin domain-containing protein [Phycisphaerae bacterium]
MCAKKSLSLGLLTLLLLNLAMADPPAVHPTTGEPLIIDCLRGTPSVIDGDLSDWNLDAMIPAVLDTAEQLNAGQASWDGPDDLSGKFYMLWDDENVYMAVIVKDDTLSMNKTGVDIWNADCVEVFFATTNRVAPHAEHYQYGFNANAQKWNWDNMETSTSAEPGSLQIAAVTTADGYICEASIPYADINQLDWSVGSIIGFHPVIDDTDAADREIQMTWTSFEAHAQDLGYGYLVLSDERAVAPELGKNPSPAHKASDVARDSVLSWTPGDYAIKHHVYFGTSYEEVNSMTVPTAADLVVTAFDPGRLEFGQTYYWRVDEVNAAPDNTVFTGDIWSFTAEPYAIRVPVDIDHVTASSFGKQNAPALTVDGSGLEGMTHSATPEQMWLSNSPDLDAWLMYEFDRTEKLDQMLIWNSNTSSEPFVGWGIKDVRIEYSVDAVDWTAISDASQISRAPGSATYDTPHVIDFGAVAARYVKINILSNWGGLLPQYGVSEVQFFAVPVHARDPKPASGSADVNPNAMATWRAGREAGEHTLYVSDDLDAVVEGLAPSVTIMTNRIDLGAFDLQLDGTYYWRVDEVNDSEAVSVWAGPVWHLMTPVALIVDDFEGYGNLSPNRPFQTWIDGYGFTNPEPGNPGNGTGAGIGHDIWTITSPYYGGDLMETVSTLPGSRQSMPFYYSNTGGVASQTDRTFTEAQDWTAGGAKTLSIAFRGQPGNTGTLFVKINNVKVTYAHDPGNIAQGAWQAWNIDLGSVNTNLQNVTTLSIGVDGSGAAGMILIDDIRLYARTGELMTPVNPGTEGLAAKFTFEGNMNDSSGHGRNGTVVGTDGTVIVSDPIRGQVLSLPGGDDQYVAVGAVGISGTMPRTIACWAKAASTDIPDWTLIFGFTGKTVEDGSGGNGSHFNIGSLGGPGGVGAHVWGWEETMISDQEALTWHHYAMTYDGTTVAYFLDGMAMDSDPALSNVQDLSASGDRVHIGSRVTQTSSFPGSVDDAVIFNRALSAEEILWLAGITQPIDKPF